MIIMNGNTENKITGRRRKLLPWWMKVFIWIFMFTGASGIVVVLLEAIGSPIHFWFVSESSIYGMQTFERFSLLGIFISTLIIFKGYTAFAMWTEKKPAIKLGLIDAVVGIIVCIIMMIVKPVFALVDGIWQMNLRFEILFLVPYLIKCWRIRKAWGQLEKPLGVDPDQV
jgi:hypothetical protein